MKRFATALGLAATIGGCTGLAPVAGYPWIEDRSLSLDHEVLLLAVDERDVRVAARFAFRGHGRAAGRVMTFPVPPPCDAPQGFTATAWAVGQDPSPVRARPAPAGRLPAGEVAHSYDIEVPVETFASGESLLLVRYRQRCHRRFTYTLKTGAYWRGPIEQLDVVVLDPHGRVRAARLDGQPPDRVASTAYVWSRATIEPRCGIELELAAPPADPIF